MLQIRALQSFARSASVVMAEFARFCANSAIATFGCKALQISYLRHICTRQIWGKFDFSPSDNCCQHQVDLALLDNHDW